MSEYSCSNFVLFQGICFRRSVLVYLSKLTVTNFRKLKHSIFEFVPGLNVIVGANNIGKTALVDALRALLAGHEEAYPRFTSDDVHRPNDGSPAKGDILFQFVFSELSVDDEADFLPALVPDNDGKFEAQISVSYISYDESGRLRPRRWCGEHEEVTLTIEMLENLRGVYLQPLRDASQGLRPGRNSQLARLLRLMGEDDQGGRDKIEKALKKFDESLQKESPIKSTSVAIVGRHESMLSKKLAQNLELGISGTDFNRLSSRLSLVADKLEIEQNGLGYNNLIFMAVVLSEMIKDPTAAYRGLIVEEPEAHLHPQLQSVLLDYLQSIRAKDNEGDIQVFVTSHSSNFASIADLDSITCLIENELGVETFFPRSICFDKKPKDHKRKRQKLERYLDITRAELFFARRVIFVEGAAELMLISVLAKILGADYDLRSHAVSLISVEGLNFDSFLPLFGEQAIQIPVSIITDADPFETEGEGNKVKSIPVYPQLDEDCGVSDNTKSMLELEDKFIKVFHGVKTLEYDLALYAENRKVMLSALKELHPQIAKELELEVEAEKDNKGKAKALFCGMFERGEGKTKVQKGRYAQVLAQEIIDVGAEFKVPNYIENAIKHVCVR